MDVNCDITIYISPLGKINSTSKTSELISNVSMYLIKLRSTSELYRLLFTRLFCCMTDIHFYCFYPYILSSFKIDNFNIQSFFMTKTKNRVYVFRHNSNVLGNRNFLLLQPDCLRSHSLLLLGRFHQVLQMLL